MTYNPGVSFFISFFELDPSKQSQCIFFTQKGTRCRWTCNQDDIQRAIELSQIINASSNEFLDLNLLQEYVFCNCCRAGGARHQDRIEDIGLLTPLAQRWYDEIQKHYEEKSKHTTPTQIAGENLEIPNVCATSLESTPGRTTIPDTPITSPSDFKSVIQTSSSASTNTSIPIVNAKSYEHSSPITSKAAVASSHPPGDESRYALRPREANTPSNPTLSPPKPIFQASLSEFRAHIAKPLPSDSVLSKIQEPLRGRDFTTGSLYVFDRTSSPGFVKIGWTAKSIRVRLEGWSKCGYTPHLVFSVHRVPHAQRAETLTHHELIKEWRRERMCKAEECRKSHQEWFEIGKDRAARVLGEWASFLQKAEPYDSRGLLKAQWKESVERLDGGGEKVTAKRLLELYEASIDKEAAVASDLVSVGSMPKTKEQGAFEDIPRLGGPMHPKDGLDHLNLLQTKLQALRSKFPPPEIPTCKTEALTKTNPPLKSESSPKSEPLGEGLSARKMEPVNEKLFSKEMPLRSSLPQSKVSLREIPSLQDTKTSQGTEDEKLSPIHAVNSLDDKACTFDISSNLEISSSVSAAVTALVSPTRSPPVTKKEEFVQIDVHIDAENSNYSQPLGSSGSSSDLIQSNASPIVAPLTVKAEPVSNSPVLLGKVKAEELIFPAIANDEELERTLTLVIQQKNADGIEEAVAKLEYVGCDTHTWGKEIESLDGHGRATKDNGVGLASDRWDEEETLVEFQT